MNPLILGIEIIAVMALSIQPSSPILTPNQFPELPRAIIPYQSPTISVGSTSGDAGDVVHIPITIETTVDISVLTIDLTYDASRLSFVSVSKSNTLLENFTLADAEEYAPGKIRIMGVALLSPPISSSGLLIDLTFSIKPNASGKAEIQIINLYDDLEGASAINGVVTINNSTPVGRWDLY